MSAFSRATLMITGGTGSFGNIILKYFLTTDIGDLCDAQFVKDAMGGVDYVFHATA